MILNLRRNLSESLQRPFVRNVITLVMGTALAQVVTVVFTPLITRLYGPEAFGLLGTFTAFVAVLGPIASLSYPIAIVLPERESDARGIVRLSLFLSFLSCAVTLFLFLVGGKRLLSALGAESIAEFALLIPLNMLFAGWVQIAQQWMIRKQQFATTARANVIQTVLTCSAKAVFGWFNPLAGVLVLITTFGNLLQAGLLSLGAWRGVKNERKTDPLSDRTPLRELAKRYSDFPLYRNPQVLINSVSFNLPVLMLAALFGSSSAGFFVLAKTLLFMPIQLVGQSVGDVFYPSITEAAQRRERLTKRIIKATLSLALIGFFPFAAVFVFGPWLFGLVFGGNWVVAGEYARWLSVMLFFTFINRPVVASIPTLGLQRGLVLYEVQSTGWKMAALYLGFLVFKSDMVAVFLFSAVGVLFYIGLILWVILSAKRQDKGSKC